MSWLWNIFTEQKQFSSFKIQMYPSLMYTLHIDDGNDET